MKQTTGVVNTEAVVDAIRGHVEQAVDWAYHDIAMRLNDLFDRLNRSFFAGRLPNAVISIGPDLVVRYAYYRIGRDDIGARHRIHLNSRHFGRSQSDVGVTLVHEMLHLHQHLHGKPSRRARYHNQEFVRMAGDIGFRARIGSGVTEDVSPRLRRKLADMGFPEDAALVPGLDAEAIRRPVRKVSWRCGCGQEAWVTTGIPFGAICRSCGGRFSRGSGRGVEARNTGLIPLVTGRGTIAWRSTGASRKAFIGEAPSDV